MGAKVLHTAVIACSLFLASQAPALGVCHAVTPSGSGSKNGSNWSNAMAGLPATLAAGDTYYLADGTYTGYIMTSSGTVSAQIVVRKAVATGDYGQNCSPSIASGWNGSTMGSSQALFSSTFYIRGAYFTLDGQTRNADWTGGGVKVIAPTCSGGGTTYGIPVDNFGAAPMPYVTLQYVEIEGGGYGLSPDTCFQTGIYAVNTLDISHLTVQYSYIHDLAGQPFTIEGTSNALIQYNFVARNNSTATNHSQGLQSVNDSNAVIRYNKWLDIVGSGVIIVLGGDGPSIAADWSIYGNLMYWTPGNPNAAYINNGIPLQTGDGVIGCINAQICSGWQIYNNTIVGANWLSGEKSGIMFVNSPTSGDMTVKNNLWDNCIGAALVATGGATLLHDYNTFISSTGYPTETNGATGSTDPFVNTATFDFRLTQDMDAAANSGGQWAQGVALSSPFNLDLTSTPRGADGTWDRGAYEFNSGTAERPNPPVLRALSVQ